MGKNYSQKIISLLEDVDNRISELSSLLGSRFPNFVQLLKGNIHDTKTQSAILSGLEDGQLKDDIMAVATANLSVKGLTPTQSEIDIRQSLFYPLTDPITLTKCLNGNGVTIKGPIVSFRRKYIIDGHHRWSQIYVVNPKATVLSVDLTLGTANPLKVLYAVQMAIAAKVKNVPIANVQGTNLFKASKSDILSFVKSTIKPEIESLFVSYKVVKDKSEIPEYIWSNVELMRSTSKPVSGAPERNHMPQTDEAPGWTTNLERGLVNWNDPL